MAKRLMLIRLETGHALRAVPEGGDPYTQGTDFTDHGDGIYSALLDAGVYDIYYKDSPQDPTWTPLEHFQGKFHPTDDITLTLDDHETRITNLEADSPQTPQNVTIKITTQCVHIKWDAQTPGTIYIVRGEYHHTGEQITVDENSRILYAGYTPECLLPNELRFADLESKPFENVVLSFKIWAQNSAGTSTPTDKFDIEIDLTSELEEFCESISSSCEKTSSCDYIVTPCSFVAGSFPTTPIDENELPTNAPAKTISFPSDLYLIRIEIETKVAPTSDADIYFADSFSGKLYKLTVKSGERFARSEATATGNPSILVRRYPESNLMIYSPSPSGLEDVEIRLWLRRV